MSDLPEAPVLVVGAGVSGLACARALAEAGRRVLLLDRARGVGGRCATHRLDGQGLRSRRSPSSTAATRSSWRRWRRCRPRRAGWPHRGQRDRAALPAGGLRRRGTAPRLRRRGDRLPAAPGVGTGGPRWRHRVGARAGRRPVRVRPEGGEPSGPARWSSRSPRSRCCALLGRPLPSTARRRRRPGAPRDFSRSEPCLALLRPLPRGRPPSGVGRLLPGGLPGAPVRRPRLAQAGGPARLGAGAAGAARPGRAAHLDDPAWPQALLAEAAPAARRLGRRGPSATHAHRWRYARVRSRRRAGGPAPGHAAVRRPAGHLRGSIRAGWRRRGGLAIRERCMAAATRCAGGGMRPDGRRMRCGRW